MLPISADAIEGVGGAAFAGEDAFGGFGPGEGFRAGVVLPQAVVDRRPQVAAMMPD